MYKTINVFNTQAGRWIDYEVSTTANTPKGVKFYSQDEDGYYVPTYREEFVIERSAAKPSVYHRPFFRCTADEYKYQFTAKKVETITTEKDVYYNSRRNKYLTRTNREFTERRTITF